MLLSIARNRLEHEFRPSAGRRDYNQA